MATMPLPTVRISIAVRIENVRSFGAMLTRTSARCGTTKTRMPASILAYSQHDSRESTIMCVTVGRPTLSLQSRDTMPASAGRAFNRHFAEWGWGCFSTRTGQGMRLIYSPTASRPLQLAACNRASNRAADVGCHAPPRGARMPRSFQLNDYSAHAGEALRPQVIHD